MVQYDKAEREEGRKWLKMNSKREEEALHLPVPRPYSDERSADWLIT